MTPHPVMFDEPLSETYRTIVEHSPNFIARYDRHARIIYHNRNIESLGFRLAEVRGKTVVELGPNSREAALYHQRIMQVITSGQATEFETQVTRPDQDHAVWHQIRLVPEFDQDGQLCSVLAIGHDIAALKQALSTQQFLAERLKLAQEIAQFGVITMCARTQQMHIDDRIREIYGYRPGQMVSEEEFRKNFHPDDYVIMTEMWRNAVAKQETYSLTFRIDRADGESRWVEARIAPKFEHGELDSLIAVHWDITARKRAEEQREQLEAQLRQVQKMEAIGTLVGGIAHDFNNILAAILGNTALLERAVSAHTASTQSVLEIAKAAQRGKALVQRLLTFVRPAEPRTQYCDLSRVAEEVMQLLRSTVPSSIELTLTVSGNPPPVPIDATQISQVILNLGVNAYQAMDNRPGTISITIDRHDVDADNMMKLAAGTYVLLAVKDNGHGMSPEIRERIFEPFFTTKPPGMGSGFGLSVVHSIVRAHKGVISVTSSEGKGSVFEIYLPCAAAGVSESASTETNAFSAPPQRTGQHILCIDDEDMIVTVMQQYLEQLGYAVDGHTDAAAAIAAFRRHPEQYDLVMTDFNMPKLSGLDVARTLLAIRPDIKIILMSGYMLPNEVGMAKDIGIKSVLFKPDAMQDIAQEIDHVLMV